MTELSAMARLATNEKIFGGGIEKLSESGMAFFRGAGGLVFWSLRWHPRYACALASAFCLCAGIRVMPVRWHPRYAFVLHASPLCGAAPTFLCRR
ncbi:hypothetical protein SB861_07320, partial [Paraburkholderia sp. SIMBA_049]